MCYKIIASQRWDVFETECILLSTGQEISWEEHLQNYLFCVEWDVKPYFITQSLLYFILHEPVSLQCVHTVILAIRCQKSDIYCGECDH